MNLLIDANVWLSYFVNLTGEGTIPQVVHTCLTSDIELLAPQELITELRRTLSSKPTFQKRISKEVAESAIAILQRVAEIPVVVTLLIRPHFPG